MSYLKFFLLFLIVGLISAAAYIMNYHQEVVPPALAKFTPTVSAQFQSAYHTAQEKISWVKEHQLKPLGDRIDQSRLVTVDESEPKPIHEKAFDYARYEYCKQVVRDWEKQEQKQSTTVDTAEN